MNDDRVSGYWTRRDCLVQTGGFLLAATAGSRLFAEDAVQNAATEPLVTFLDPQGDVGESPGAVVGRTPLLHTAQLLPGTTQEPRPQIAEVLGKLDAILNDTGSRRELLVRLHVVAANQEVCDEARRQLAAWLPAGVRPAVTFVVAALSSPQALVGLDAVAAAPAAKAAAVSHVRTPQSGRPQGCDDATILPAGRVVFVSGQAVPDVDLGEATRKTLLELKDTLRHLELDLSHVVQLKCFLQPMTGIDRVEQELRAFFGDRPVPATVHVEWTSASPPIEIELIAAAPPGTVPQADGRITFVTPPALKPSPIYSRVAVLDGERTLYLSGLYGEAGTGEAEVRSIFDRLGKRLTQAGSDFRHLAKATYYVADDESSRALNVVRPDFYDPQRPPAASKAPVRGSGRAGQRLVVDMIAVPAE